MFNLNNFKFQKIRNLINIYCCLNNRLQQYAALFVIYGFRFMLTKWKLFRSVDKNSLFIVLRKRCTYSIVTSSLFTSTDSCFELWFECWIFCPNTIVLQSIVILKIVFPLTEHKKLWRICNLVNVCKLTTFYRDSQYNTIIL